MSEFYFYHLQANANHHGQMLDDLNALPERSQLWGVFSGLFGLASNELFVVSSAQLDAFPSDSKVLSQERWQATARPTSAAGLVEPGLYVFRRFHVRNADVEELVELSQAAWQTFEHGENYASQPVGLFRPDADADTNIERSDADAIVRMQLVTWYDGFPSWSASRTPHPDASENFRRRHQLTTTTYAIATQLQVPGA